MNKIVRNTLKLSVLTGLVVVALVGVAHPKGEEGDGMCPEHGGLMGMTMGHHGSGGDEQARNKHQERMIERVSDALVLDANQKQRLTVLSQKWHAFQEAERASSHDKDPRQAMLGLLAGDHLDQKGAQAWVEQRTQTLRSQSPELIKAAADFFDSLRPEQQQKVRKFIAHGSHAKMGGKGMMLHQEASDHADVPAHSGH